MTTKSTETLLKEFFQILHQTTLAGNLDPLTNYLETSANDIEADFWHVLTSLLPDEEDYFVQLRVAWFMNRMTIMKQGPSNPMKDIDLFVENVDLFEHPLFWDFLDYAGASAQAFAQKIRQGLPLYKQEAARRAEANKQKEALLIERMRPILHTGKVEDEGTTVPKE